MSIYILDENHEECAKMLDDKSLDKMIRDIAHVLCNVHWRTYWHEGIDKYRIKTLPSIKYVINKNIKLWEDWANKSKINYEFLCRLGEQLCIEKNFRHDLKLGFFKKWKIIYWARDNVPDLSECPHNFCKRQCNDILGTMNFESNQFKICHEEYKFNLPLILPKKYWCGDGTKFNTSIIQSYRNYYEAKLKTKYKCRWVEIGCIKCPQWTNREKPEWIF